MSFVVTIDGPGAAGKSTTARAVAARLGFLYLDTGALYRALAYKVLENGIPADDLEAVLRCAGETEIDLSGSPEETHVWLDGMDVRDRIRTPAVSELASRLAAQPGVRARLVQVQRALGDRGPVVAEGRDLGTVVFPHAQVKIYLDAELDTRTRRRHHELQARGIAAGEADVRDELARRDSRDLTRTESPLRPAPGAHVLLTGGLDFPGQVEAVLNLVRAHPDCPRRETAPREGGGGSG
jgi:cytidylate kinase